MTKSTEIRDRKKKKEGKKEKRKKGKTNYFVGFVTGRFNKSDSDPGRYPFQSATLFFLASRVQRIHR